MNENFPKVQWPGWETVDVIGQGSFGAVYKIQRDVLGETEVAALKMISIPQNAGDIDEMISEGADAESITSTFQSHLKSIVAEYSLMHKMKGSSNVVNCDDVRYVQHEDGIGWDIFIKMELLTPLIKVLPRAYSEEMVLKIAKDMCNALILCQKHGIVHRDVKPQNIFLSDNGDYKLGDFGVAKMVEKTTGGTKIGTYKYMAPEVFHNKPYGSNVDVYSLGLVLYWLMNERRLPFLPLPPEKLSAELDRKARERRLSGEKIPAPVNGSDELKRIVLKACAFDQKDRYQSAQDMLVELEKVKEAAPRKKKKLWLLGMISGVAVVAALALVLLLGGGAKNKLQITAQPSAAVTTAGETIEVSVGAEGKGLRYAWMLAQPESDDFEQTEQTNATFSQQADPALDGCRLYCVITDEKGNTVQTETVTLRVKAPIVITAQPVDVVADVGETVEVTVEAEGRNLQYQWWFAEKDQTEFQASSVQEAVYAVTMDQSRNGRQLYCEITDEAGNSVTTDVVTISMRASLVIVKQPESVQVGLGQMAEVTVDAWGENLKYEWYFKDKDTFAKTDSFKDNTYAVEMNPERDGRQLYCVITAKDGSSVQTQTVTISMKTIKILKQPANATAAPGDQVVVSVKAEGENLTYSWWFAEKGETTFKESSIKEQEYAVEMEAARDGRQLYCVITDAYGYSVTTETVVITMDGPIVIVSQPQNMELEKGKKGTVKVVAKGENLTYTWYYKNATDKVFQKTNSFTENTYTLEMDDARNGRQVYCVITDGAGNRVQTETVTFKMK